MAEEAKNAAAVALGRGRWTSLTSRMNAGEFRKI